MLRELLWAAVAAAGLTHTAEADVLSLNDNGTPFDVTFLDLSNPTCVVLFAVGSGGNPERHLPLLTSLVDHGCAVVAPHFERLVSPRPTEGDLLQRARRLRLALDYVARPKIPAFGVGHSIGATTLLALAGAQLWLGPGQRLDIEREGRFDRLVLMTPPTGFFQAPGALDGVNIPLQVWAGTHDSITPPAQAEFLKSSVEDRIPVDLRVIDGAGHFSFMNTLPPQMVDPCPDRAGLLEELSVEIRRFMAD